MMDRCELAREGLREAVRLRRRIGLGRCDPMCIYDVLEEKLHIEVKFQALSSMEGMYIRKGSKPVILLGSDRPPGRQAYTCAHELGHHVFGHGARVDECLDTDQRATAYDPDEWLADRFAAFFLMPRHAVEKPFLTRGWHWESCQPLQFYIVAGQLGVGYESLIQQMRWSLGMLTPSQAKACLAMSPKQLRVALLKRCASSHMLIVDRFWDPKVAADLRVGDYAVLPARTLPDQQVIRIVGDCEMGTVVEATKPGTERVMYSDAADAVNVRVSRNAYAGRSLFRHLEDPDYE